MAYRRVRNYGNTMSVTSGAETANSSRAHEYTQREIQKTRVNLNALQP
jgi:hypothetical protein